MIWNPYCPLQPCTRHSCKNTKAVWKRILWLTIMSDVCTTESSAVCQFWLWSAQVVDDRWLSAEPHTQNPAEEHRQTQSGGQRVWKSTIRRQTLVVLTLLHTYPCDPLYAWQTPPKEKKSEESNQAERMCLYRSKTAGGRDWEEEEKMKTNTLKWGIDRNTSAKGINMLTTISAA